MRNIDTGNAVIYGRSNNPVYYYGNNGRQNVQVKVENTNELLEVTFANSVVNSVTNTNSGQIPCLYFGIPANKNELTGPNMVNHQARQHRSRTNQHLRTLDWD